MQNPFRLPYREIGTTRNKLVVIGVFGLFIFLFLFLFKPFGMESIETFHQLLFSLGFGGITSMVLLVFKFVIEPVVVGPRWTLGKNILWDLLIASSIGVANYCYISVIYKMDFSPKYLLYAIWTAILVGIIPVTIIHIMEYNKMYRKALEKADIPHDETLWDSEVMITAGNEKNNLKLNPRHIIYLCSNDNYVTVAFLKDNSISKVTIRGTLKAAEEELSMYKKFLRCHKCYIVNRDYIDRVSGHSQNMKIRLHHSDDLIPVSRSKAGEMMAASS